LSDYRLKDHYFLKAKEDGFKSRASYKLIEINQKYPILKRGFKVLDLGAAPGGWMQVAGDIVGKKGKVIGIDKITFDMPQKDNLEVIMCDIEDDSERKKVLKAIGSVDVVLSDMAPKLSGIKDADNTRIYYLAELAFEISREVLRNNGTLLLKVFQREELKDYRKMLKKHFKSVDVIIPKARRRESSEVYVLARNYSKDDSL